MRNLKKFTRTVGIPAAAAVAVLAGSSMAFAASSYNVAAGSAASGTTLNWTGTTTGTSPQVQWHNVTSGGSLFSTCLTAAAHGTTTVGTGLANPLAQIATTSAGVGTTWTGCKDTATGMEFTVTGTYPWSLNGNGDTVAGKTPGTISNINAHVHANNGTCDFDVKDQSGSAGRVDVKWTNGSPSTLEVLNNPTLAIKNVSGFGCGLVGMSNDDVLKFHAIYNVTADIAANNPITVTSNP